MDDPVSEIASVIRSLTQGSPSEQQETIETYFTRDAVFTHPFCWTGSFNTSFGNSRDLIKAIYRWYKILSPSIELHIEGVAHNPDTHTLYVDISQVFRVWAIPFYVAPVSLTTVLKLQQKQGTDKFLIKAQNDLYQVDQFVRFVLPWGIGVFAVLVWHTWATAACVLGAIIFAPITWLEEGQARRRRKGGSTINGDGSGDVGEDEVKKLMGFGSEGKKTRKYGDMTVVRPD